MTPKVRIAVGRVFCCNMTACDPKATLREVNKNAIEYLMTKKTKLATRNMEEIRIVIPKESADMLRRVAKVCNIPVDELLEEMVHAHASGLEEKYRRTRTK